MGLYLGFSFGFDGYVGSGVIIYWLLSLLEWLWIWFWRKVFSLVDRCPACLLFITFVPRFEFGFEHSIQHSIQYGIQQGCLERVLYNY